MVALLVLLLILALFGGLGFAAHFLWFVLRTCPQQHFKLTAIRRFDRICCGRLTAGAGARPWAG